MNVKIEKLVYGGEGLGHFEGSTVFVPFVLPGEVVAVRPVARKKKFVRGHVQHLVTPSPDRASPPCMHFGACGGCHYQHIPYEAQVSYKANILRETLSRLGRVQWEGEIFTHPSPPLGYRNRAQWKFRPAGEGGEFVKMAVGYFRAGSSALLPIERCPILAQRLEEVYAALHQLAAGEKLPGALREVEAFCDHASERVLLNASLSEFGAQCEQTAQALRDAVPGIESVLLHETSRDRFELFGPGFIHYQAAGARYRVGHLSFFQVNRFLVDEMTQAVTGGPGSTGALALDLYAGVGLFTIPLARQFARVVAVEANPAAERDLGINVHTAEGNVRAVNMEVEDYLKGSDETPDLVVLDPPRAGVPAPALARLRAIAPQRIAYLSCDPATLARDLGILTAAGQPGASYRIASMHLFDLFPQTFHIETLVHLTRA